MITRRDFIKRTAYTGAAVLMADQFLNPVTAFANIRSTSRTDSGMECILDPLYQMMQHDPYESSKCLDLAELSTLYGRCGNEETGLKVLSEAIITAREIEDRRELASVLSRIADAYYSIGKPGTASDIMSEVLDILYLEIINTDTYAYTDIIFTSRMLDKVGQREKALSWLDEALERRKDDISSDKTVQMIRIRAIGEAYIALGADLKAKKAAKVLQYATYEPLKRIRGMAAIAEGLAERGRSEDARELIAACTALRNNLDEGAQRWTERDISIIHAKLGEWDKAFEIADSSRDEDSYFRIARHAADTGNMEIAKKAAYPALVDLKNDDDRYIFMLSSPEVADLFLSLEDSAQAVRTINRSLSYMDSSNVEECWRVKELSGSAAVLVKMGNEPYALKLLHRAFANVITQRGVIFKNKSLLRIVGVYMDHGIPAGKKEKVLMDRVIAAC